MQRLRQRGNWGDGASGAHDGGHPVKQEAEHEHTNEDVNGKEPRRGDRDPENAQEDEACHDACEGVGVLREIVVDPAVDDTEPVTEIDREDRDTEITEVEERLAELGGAEAAVAGGVETC